jgi:hypothetical protein
MSLHTCDWVTYESSHSNDTRLTTEPRPLGSRFRGVQPRPATPEEITVEVTRRYAQAEHLTKIKQFTQREEYALAQSIRAEIDCMYQNNHPLDRLTLEQWRMFKQLVCG